MSGCQGTACALADVGAAGGEIRAHGGVDAKLGADVGSGEVVGDVSARRKVSPRRVGKLRG